MTFADALNHIMYGRKPVRRIGWPEGNYINLGNDQDLAITLYTVNSSTYWENTPADLLAKDWELFFLNPVE